MNKLNLRHLLGTVLGLVILMPTIFITSSANVSANDIIPKSMLDIIWEVEGVRMSGTGTPVVDYLIEYEGLETITTDSAKRPINKAMSEERGFPIYGQPHGDTKKITNVTFNGITISGNEHRYVGYSVDGIPITSVWFPHDADAGKQLAKNWIKEPWNYSQASKYGFAVNPKRIMFDETTEQQLYDALENMINPYNPSEKWIETYAKSSGAKFTDVQGMLDYIGISVMPKNYHPGVIGMLNNTGGTIWYETFLTAPPIPFPTASIQPVGIGTNLISAYEYNENKNAYVKFALDYSVPKGIKEEDLRDVSHVFNYYVIDAEGFNHSIYRF